MSTARYRYLADARLVVCLGPGGVGKTTISAALALDAALAGRWVDVMTVDPAPRLLDALGLAGEGGDEPAEVALDVAWAGGGAHRGTAPAWAARMARSRPILGRLRAMRLDAKRTFDAIVALHAPSPAARDAILGNRIYRNLSQALAGVGDYMAMERLLELLDDPQNELVVLDTPPAADAIDFLDAPRRLLELLGSRAITLLGGGARRGLGVMDFAARAVLTAFDRLTGLHLLGDVQAFVRGFDGMYAGFAERAARAQALLGDSDTIIAVVTTAEAQRIDQTIEFLGAIERAGIEVGALIVNRLMPELTIDRSARYGAALARKIARAEREFAALRTREIRSVAQLREAVSPGTKILGAPDLGAEPSTLADLARIGARLGEL
ncbi:MAG TPA: ArsA-related P-loop ATPase [Candidatus Binataceae bacterium]|nr:ArsA-related P-loop ATPase [Candidatus Binataceae bacterium]